MSEFFKLLKACGAFLLLIYYLASRALRITLGSFRMTVFT
jgi:hypothetical protein